MVVAAILVVVGVLVFGGDDDSGGGGGAIKSAAAASGLESILRDASFDEEGQETLRTCPLGDVDDLTAAVGKVIELDDQVVDGVEESALTEESDLPGFLACQINAEEVPRDGPAGLFFQAIQDPPRDYEGYISEFSGDLTSLDFEDPVEYMGGEVFLFCAEAIEEDGYTGCDADWVNTDDNIALNIFLAGEGMNTEDAFTALKAVIVTMADNLAEAAPTES